MSKNMWILLFSETQTAKCSEPKFVIAEIHFVINNLGVVYYSPVLCMYMYVCILYAYRAVSNAHAVVHSYLYSIFDCVLLRLM